MSKIPLSGVEFELLRELVQKQSGIRLGDEKSYLIETRLGSMVKEAGCTSFRQFYDHVSGPGGASLREKMIDAMTTNETLWFRDAGPWKILNNKLLPEFCAQLRAGKRNKVRIWSVASSTGQEPYSVSMSILEYLEKNAPPGVQEEMFEIVATDISPSALFIAISGRYDDFSMGRGLDPLLRDRYFERHNGAHAIHERVKNRVRFQQLNLIDSFEALGRFDLVLCRNVMIYFSAETKRDIVTRIAERLNNDGTLIIGASESLQGCLSHFGLQQNEGQLFYKLKAGGGG